MQGLNSLMRLSMSTERMSLYSMEEVREEAVRSSRAREAIHLQYFNRNCLSWLWHHMHYRVTYCKFSTWLLGGWGTWGGSEAGVWTVVRSSFATTSIPLPSSHFQSSPLPVPSLSDFDYLLCNPASPHPLPKAFT